jgi:hypothetical protein
MFVCYELYHDPYFIILQILVEIDGLNETTQVYQILSLTLHFCRQTLLVEFLNRCRT